MLDAENAPQDPPLSLRERRRRQTRGDLADAALELFEKHGLQGTSTEDIAAAAGVSPRTFFRYADTKEQAIFVNDDGFDILVARVEASIEGGAHPLDAIEQAQVLLLSEFDQASEERQAKFLRRRGVVLSEPNLLARALATDAAQSERLLKIARTADTAASELESRARVTALATALRVTFDEWVLRAEKGQWSSVVALHAEVRAAFASYYGAAGGSTR